MRGPSLSRHTTEIALYALFALGLGVALLLATGVLSGWEWYSPSLEYRWQTDAILRGELAISKSAYLMSYDRGWHAGVHPLLGLGISFLRLPFEYISRFVAGEPFPDVFCLGLVVALSAGLLLKVSSLFEGERGGRFLRFMWTIWLLFLPPVVMLMQTRFIRYEEAVAYGYFSALCCFALLLQLVEEFRIGRYLLFCFLCGFLALVRPSIFVYGIVALLLQLFFGRIPSRRTLLAGGLLCALGPLVALITNYYRFGAFFEFGNRVTGSNPEMAYLITFAPGFEIGSFTKAARELLSALFSSPSLNGFDHYRPAFFPGQSEAIRFRELYFSTYSSLWCVLVTFFWGVVPCLGILARRFWSGYQLPRLVLLCFWFSLTSAVALTPFYLHYNALTSRYLVDYALAFAVAVLGLALLLGDVMQRVWQGWRLFAGRVLLLLALLCWSICSIYYGEVAPDHAHIARYSRAILDSAMASLRQPLYTPAESYACGEFRQIEVPPSNLMGWRPKNCKAGPLVFAFIAAAHCYRLTLSMPAKASLEDISAVQIKAGAEFLRQVQVTSLSEGQQEMRFCHQDHVRERLGKNALEVLEIATVAPEHVFDLQAYPQLWRIEVAAL